MAEAVAVETKKHPVAIETEPKKQEMIKNPKAAFQAFETGAKDRLRHLTESGNARLTELDRLLGRVSKEDWSFSGMSRRVKSLRGRAENARASALERLDEMPGVAVTAIASAGRARIQYLARGLKWVAEHLEPTPKPAPRSEQKEG